MRESLTASTEARLKQGWLGGLIADRARSEPDRPAVEDGERSAPGGPPTSAELRGFLEGLLPVYIAPPRYPSRPYWDHELGADAVGAVAVSGEVDELRVLEWVGRGANAPADHRRAQRRS